MFNLFKPKSKKKHAMIFIDYESWFYSYKTLYNGMRPDPKRFRENLEQEFMPLRQIAEKFGLSTSRIRRILAIIEMKFRNKEMATFLSKGIAGTVKANYEKGYSVGYDEGYINGLKAGREEVTRPFEKEHILALPIEALCLKPATFKHLKDAGYDTISDVYAITDKEVRKIKGLKPDRRREIIAGFKRYKIGKPDWKL